jgi:hypothetical protein
MEDSSSSDDSNLEDILFDDYEKLMLSHEGATRQEEEQTAGIEDRPAFHPSESHARA